LHGRSRLDGFRRPLLWKRPAHPRIVLAALALTLTVPGCGGGGGGGGGGDNTAKAPARVKIIEPANYSTVKGRKITIRGTASPPDGTLEISLDQKPKRSVTATDGEWSTTLALSPGLNTITARGDDGGSATLMIGLELTRAQRAAARERNRVRRERVRERRETGRQDFINEAQPIDYAQLEKDADSYVGEKVKVYGQIFQIQQEGDLGGVMLIAVTDEGYDIWTDNVWVDYTGRVKGAKDDLITIYGTVEGEKQYETQIGGQTYVPQITAKYIEEP